MSDSYSGSVVLIRPSGERVTARAQLNTRPAGLRTDWGGTLWAAVTGASAETADLEFPSGETRQVLLEVRGMPGPGGVFTFGVDQADGLPAPF